VVSCTLTISKRMHSCLNDSIRRVFSKIFFSTRERLAAMMQSHAPHCAPPSSSSWTTHDVDVALCCGSDLLASMALPGVWDQQVLNEPALLLPFFLTLSRQINPHRVSSSIPSHLHQLLDELLSEFYVIVIPRVGR
jgi:hypothetical protein